LTSAPNPSILGQVVTLTATVTSGSTKIPSGDTVTFKDGGTTLGTKLTKSSGVATFTTTALSVGTHSITAVYAGDSNIATSTSLPLSHAVTGAATKLVWQQQPASSFDRNTTIAPPMTVLIEDASGNVVNSSASVKISLNTNGSDKVAGTVTAKAVNGVATFSDINITGNQAHQSATFIASSTGLASAVSITFTIN
jgi:Bacterial Ig-like domain (group 3)